MPAPAEAVHGDGHVDVVEEGGQRRRVRPGRPGSRGCASGTPAAARRRSSEAPARSAAARAITSVPARASRRGRPGSRTASAARAPRDPGVAEQLGEHVSGAPAARRRPHGVGRGSPAAGRAAPVAPSTQPTATRQHGAGRPPMRVAQRPWILAATTGLERPVDDGVAAGARRSAAADLVTSRSRRRRRRPRTSRTPVAW